MSDNNEQGLYDDEPAQRVGNGPTTQGEPSKMENVAALGKNPKTSRVILATGAAVAIVGGIALVSVISRNKPQSTPTPAAITGADVGAVPQLSTDPNAALANSRQYKDIVDAAAKKRAADALESGQSAQPLAVTVESSLQRVPTPAEQAASAAAAEKLRAQQAVAQAAAMPAQQVQAQQQPDPAYQQMMQNAQVAMSAMIAPRPKGSQTFTVSDATVTAATFQQVGAAQGLATRPQAVAAVAASSSAATTTPSQVTLIGAGLIESARIDTAVNTDVGGQFGATMLTGKYAGAKLIGTVQRKGELAQLQVTTMSLPAQGVSVPASAIVLDAETSETGTASDVDRKLFVKYGVKPLAAGFAAVADYLKSAGTTVNVNGSTVTTSNPELTNQRAAQIVGGSAAAQLNTDANALDTTPTVRVTRGAIVGVFFTQDVVYTPKKN